MQNDTITADIRVLLFREDDVWVAQCVEYDIGAQASDLPTLRRWSERVNNIETAGFGI